MRTSADHAFSVPGRGWIRAGHLRPGDLLCGPDGQLVAVEAFVEGGDNELIPPLNPGTEGSPNPSHSLFPIIGFTAGTPIMTAEGYKPIEEIGPGDFIQSGPECEPSDDCDGEEAPEPPRWWEQN